MGAGKSTVLAEASDILGLQQIGHAAIDLDALGLACLTSTSSTDDLMYQNLQSVCANYASAGVARLLLARAMENAAELERCRRAVCPKQVVICRLTARLEEMQRRVRVRESGVSQQEYVARVVRLNDVLDGAGLEHFTLTNE